ncbi:MAG: hypothetical protein JNK52_13295 [Zoogloeaceae bacterium]|nr:hypothetical protein [Zoogloeaceae bacterium]
MRTLLILALALLAFWWVRRSVLEMQRKRKDRQARERDAKAAPERMLACAHCGLHVPEGDGVHGEGGFYCCDEHRRLGVRR